ncbi:hypothetical protein GBA84_00985 [Bifidobacterium catenulatum]|nr:hypothetical protein GBA84_00985 [Bifidobacterium catenulatum]KAB7465011.1 hypothetical protein GBA80_00990 [Bifidobacterium catenulatum]
MPKRWNTNDFKASNATIHMGDAMTDMLKQQINGKAPTDYVISARRRTGSLMARASARRHRRTRRRKR